MEGGINLFSYVAGNPLNVVDRFGLAPQDRVNWALNQYKHNKKFWKGRDLCNEFVRAAHKFGDPDAEDFPSFLRECDFFGCYTYPRVEDLADPNSLRSQLEYLSLADVQPGDIIVWHDNHGTGHSAIYIGNDEVIYQHKGEGVKKNTIEGTSQRLPGFHGEPIVRRYKYPTVVK